MERYDRRVRGTRKIKEDKNYKSKSKIKKKNRKKVQELAEVFKKDVSLDFCNKNVASLE